ncbi:acyltransferase family protein [Corynebacterium confusum]
MSQDSLRSFQYRYDLDGLRGIAIGLVVIYHVFVGRVSGGVDVFLLLSGYFFLGSQLRYVTKPNATFNPWWPIWRTLRRLVPALALVIAVTYLLVYFWTPQLMRIELAQQITATMLYYQNWELASQNADYAAAAADTSPLQHMWSMSVQGQFYLLGIAFALILGAVLRWRGRSSKVNAVAGPILIVVTIASFAYASRFGFFGTPENYYSTFSRAWELTLGAVLAIYGHRIRIPQRLSDVVTGLGLLLLMFTGAAIADSTAYPGPLSLIPLGGAVLIIIGGGSRISRAMASKPARWLGDVAYSLYLWHWPLLILSTSALGMERPAWWLGAIIIALSLVLADATHRFIEAPLRQHRKRPLADDMPVHKAMATMREKVGALRAAGGVAATALVIALLSVHPWFNSTLDSEEAEYLDPTLYPGVMALMGQDVPANQPVKPDPVRVGSMVPPVAYQHCFIPDTAPGDSFFEIDKDGNPCIFGDPASDVEVYLVGGSHAEQYASAIDSLGKEMSFKVVPLLRQDCPVELGDELTVTPECAQWSELATERILDADPDLVISNTTRPRGEHGTGPDVVPAGYERFWEVLADNEIPFLGLRENPWGFDKNFNPIEFDECYVANEDAIGCGTTREQNYQPVDPSAAILAQWPNMIAVDTSDWYCDADKCPVVIGNVMVYRDMHHISNAYAMSMKPLLEDLITPFLAGEPQQQEAPAPPVPEDEAEPEPAEEIYY